MQFTEDEQQQLNRQKAAIKRAKGQMAKIGNTAKLRSDLEDKVAAEQRLAKLKMDSARKRFRLGIDRLLKDAKNADRTYDLTVVDTWISVSDSDTATLTVKVQRLP